jgi:hypothetical protein
MLERPPCNESWKAKMLGLRNQIWMNSAIPDRDSHQILKAAARGRDSPLKPDGLATRASTELCLAPKA